MQTRPQLVYRPLSLTSVDKQTARFDPTASPAAGIATHSTKPGLQPRSVPAAHLIASSGDPNRVQTAGLEPSPSPVAAVSTCGALHRTHTASFEYILSEVSLRLHSI